MQQFFLSFFTENNYIDFYWIVILFALTPFIKVNKWLYPLVAYIWLSALVRNRIFDDTSWAMAVNMSLDEEFLFVSLIMFLFIFFFNSKAKTKAIENVLAYLGLFNMLLTILFIPFDNMWLSGIIPNKSMNAILNVMFLPFVCRLKWLFYGIPTFFVVCLTLESKSSTAFLALVVSCVVAFLKFKGGKRKEKMLVMAICLILLLGLGFLFVENLFQPYQRFDDYRFFFKTFNSWWFGRGPGSFYHIGRYEQYLARYDVSNGWRIFLHSDPLQFVYEYGLVGIPLLISAVIWIIRFSPPHVLVAWSAWVAGGVFYYTAHFPTHVLFMYCLLKLTNNHYEAIKK